VSGDELCWRSATELAADIRSGRVSPVEVVDAVLARIERVNPRINAFCTIVADTARADARQAERAAMRGEPLGPLHGVPIAFKDLTITAGIRTTFGSKIFEHHVPKEDAPVVERARAAGAIVLGKTNTPEFGCKGVTDNRVFGVTRNPWRLDRVPGGSSGGAAAALAAGLGPLGEGSDLAGSIRVPAACCGVVGLKPSLGRVPKHPRPSPWTDFGVTGPMARTVRDAALLLSVMAGPDERDPGSLPASDDDFARAADGGVRSLRVAWTADLGYATVDPECRDAVAAAARRLADVGCGVEQAHPGFEDPLSIFLDVTAPARAARLLEWVPEWRDWMDPILLDRLRHAERVSAVDLERAQHRRATLWEAVRRFFERFDVLLTPATATPPFSLDRQYPSEIAGRPVTSPLAWMAFTYPFALTGQPAIAVPGGWSRDGVPLGVQIVGRRFADATVLRAAAAFEAAQPWSDRRPSL